MKWLQQYIDFKFHWIHGIWFALGYVLFTIIGTLSHEAGHYAIATKYFENPSLHYGYVNYGKWKELEDPQNWIIDRSDSDGIVLPEYEEEYDRLIELRRKHSFYTTLGGPLQTIIFGTIGFIWLLLRRKKPFGIKSWLLVFLAFFWSREVYMMVFLTFDWLVLGEASYAGDEATLALLLDWHPLGIAFILGCIGSLILGYVIFYLIPLEDRFTFIISGLLGSIVGFWFWLDFIGPLVLP